MSTIKFDTALKSLEQPLFAFAFKLTQNRDDAFDLFQETSFRALNNWDKFHQGTNFRAWLFTIMKNMFINNYRRKKKMSVIFDSTDNYYFINSGSLEVKNGGESVIMMNELTSMLDSLSDNIRIPFLMSYEGFKYNEIAQELDLPLGTIKSRIFFARKEMKRLINLNYT